MKDISKKERKKKTHSFQSWRPCGFLPLKAPAASGATHWSHSICDSSLFSIIQMLSESRGPAGSHLSATGSWRIWDMHWIWAGRNVYGLFRQRLVKVATSRHESINQRAARRRGQCRPTDVTEPLMSDACQRASAVLHQWMLGGRRDPIVTWDWGWLGPMWMNDPLGVTRMKWQIQEEERHGLICHSQLCPHFRSVSILWVLLPMSGAAGSQGRWEIILVLKLPGRVEADPNVAEQLKPRKMRQRWFQPSAPLIVYNEYNGDVSADQGQTSAKGKKCKSSAFRMSGTKELSNNLLLSSTSSSTQCEQHGAIMLRW